MTFCKYRILIAFSFSALLFLSCGKDEIVPGENGPSEGNRFILEESAFGCTDYESHDFFGEDLNALINDMYRYKDYYLFSMSQHQGGGHSLEVRSSFAGDVLLKEDIQANKFLEFEDKMLICAEEGIYELTEEINLIEKSNQRCYDMIISKNNQLIFSGYATDLLGIYYPSIEYVDRFSSPAWQSGTFGLQKLSLGPGNTIWATGHNAHVFKFDGPWYREKFHEENSILFANDSSSDGQHFFNYNDRLFLVEKSVSRAQILEYTDGSWVEVIELSDYEGISIKRKNTLTFSYNDVIVFRDHLFIGTSEGTIIKFDLTAPAPWQDSDFEVIDDPDLPYSSPFNYINKFYKDKEENIYVTTSKHTVTKMTCF